MNKIFPIISFILFLFMEIYFPFYATGANDTIYKVIILFLLMLSLIELGKKTIIDLGTKTIETSIFGLLNKKQIEFHEIKRFVTTQHRTNFIKNGVSLSLEYLKDEKQKPLKWQSSINHQV